MALDFVRDDAKVSAFQLIAFLCRRAEVALRDPEFPLMGCELHEATFDMEDGLLVRDSEGNWFRLDVTPTPIEKGD